MPSIAGAKISESKSSLESCSVRLANYREMRYAVKVGLLTQCSAFGRLSSVPPTVLIRAWPGGPVAGAPVKEMYESKCKCNRRADLMRLVDREVKRNFGFIDRRLLERPMNPTYLSFNMLLNGGFTRHRAWL